MVENTGKTLRTGTSRPLNTPEPVRVEEDPSGLPIAIRMRRRQAITAIQERWRIDDEWWRSEPVSRIYYAIMLASGEPLTLYKDLAKDGWYRQTY